MLAFFVNNDGGVGGELIRGIGCFVMVMQAMKTLWG